MKIICSKCEGYGKIPDMTERVSTLGISWLFEKLEGSRIGWIKCPKCKGTGSLKV